MKRIIALLLSLTLVIGLAACDKPVLPDKSTETAVTASEAAAPHADMKKAAPAYAAYLAQFNAFVYAYVKDINGDGYPEVFARPGDFSISFMLTYTDKAGLSVLNPCTYSSHDVSVFISEDNCFYYRDDGHTTGTAFVHSAYIYSVDETGFVLDGQLAGDEWPELEEYSDEILQEMDEKYDRLFDEKLQAAVGDKIFSASFDMATGTEDPGEPDAYLNDELGIDIEAARQTFADAEQHVTQSVTDAAGQKPDSVFVADYDRNGTFEGFAFITDDEYEFDVSIGSLWFADESGNAQEVQTGIAASENMGMMPCTYHTYFQAPLLGGSSAPTTILEVHGGSCQEVKMFRSENSALEIATLAYSSDLIPGTIISTLSTFDAAFSEEIVDEETGEMLGAGHTHKPYYFRDTPEGIKEYGGIEVKPSDVEKISGGKKLLELANADGKNLKNIYYRENNVFNFSMSAQDEEETLYYYFNAVLEDGKLRLLYKDGEMVTDPDEADDYLCSGFYVAAAYPENATYPDSITY